MFPLDDSTPKHQTATRGRGKSGSLQTSSAAKLFENSQKQDEADELGGDRSISTSVDMEGPHTEEGLGSKPISTDEKLEHPLFPWQMKRRNQTSTSKGQQDTAGPRAIVKSSATVDEETLMDTPSSSTRGQSGSLERSLKPSMDSSAGRSFQEQLLHQQQQGQVQEHLKRLQSQGGEAYTSEGVSKTSERGAGRGEKEGSEWKAMQERMKEVEALLEQEKAGQQVI